MHKNYKLSIIIVLLILAASLYGCGTTTTPEAVAGNYKASFDMAPAINEGLQASMSIDEMDVDFFLELTEDGNYKLYNDENQVKDSVITALIRSLKGSLTEKQVTTIVENDPSFTGLAISETGTFVTGSGSITFDPDAEKPQKASVEKDGSLKMTLETNSFSADLQFIKQ